MSDFEDFDTFADDNDTDVDLFEESSEDFANDSSYDIMNTDVSNEGENNAPITGSQLVNSFKNASNKKKAFICAGVVFFVVLVLILVARTPKRTVEVSDVDATQQVVTADSKSNVPTVDLVQVSNLVMSMQTLEDTVARVNNKTQYLKGNQLLYCLDLVYTTADGAQHQSSYFCTYDVWFSVQIGDNLGITYGKVSDNCYAIMQVK